MAADPPWRQGRRWTKPYFGVQHHGKMPGYWATITARPNDVDGQHIELVLNRSGAVDAWEEPRLLYSTLEDAERDGEEWVRTRGSSGHPRATRVIHGGSMPEWGDSC